jgi:hydroxymethylpyrimidine/phosphomethylpyrimidine kinase
MDKKDHRPNETIVALTIAGFDPSGGAGVIADIKTFIAFKCFPTSAITSLTFQNTMGVFGAAHQTAETVRAQIIPIVEDFDIACIKTGMLPSREIIEEIARLIEDRELPAPVVDTVVRSTSGYDLIDDEALKALVSKLLPLAAIVTPNIPEAERITGLKIVNEDDMYQASDLILKMGARAVLVKGGHLEGDAIDILNIGGEVTIFREKRIDTTSTHGTGCTLAAAIAASLGSGLDLKESVRRAKEYVTLAIGSAPKLGHGHGPIGMIY